MFRTGIGFHISCYCGHNAKNGKFYIPEDSYLKNYFKEGEEYAIITTASIQKGKCISVIFGGVLKFSKFDRFYVNPRSSIALSMYECGALGLDEDGDGVFLVKIKDGEKK